MSKTKIEPLVHLNTNPCKMCMPLGAVTAFYGIQKSMSILHGSQGCSTYIRRHMATHYNEPIDIASSSLTEEGTVFGGEQNLLLGLKNLIDIYHPEVIGVSTTCLAETIGEDVPAMIDKFYKQNPLYQDIHIIPVNTPGYGGTQYEGYYQALYSILSNVKMDTSKNEFINVILPPASPEDTRLIKKAFADFNIPIILLPDLSDNLDGEYRQEYHKLPAYGTSIDDITKMAGAKLTLELGCQVEKNSPGRYLEESYGVTCLSMELPVGLRDTDAFYKELAVIAGMTIPEEITRLRGRFLDAMIDSHKYSGEGRAVIYGDPSFAIATVRLCIENGVMPLVVATGSVSARLKLLLKNQIDTLAEKYFVERYEILDDVDFKTLETLAVSLKANILIGNSDGRRIEELLHIPLIRRGFPIHDRVGGQRLKTVLYEGSMNFIEDIANGLLTKKETGFREELYDKYYPKEIERKAGEDKIMADTNIEDTKIADTNIATTGTLTIEEKTKSHPCYSGCASGFARMHLAVAPLCNIQCNYCVRKFDCPNESRPGVTSKILTPIEALEKYKLVKEKMSNLTVVGIAGPGDALANFQETRQTLEMIRAYDPQVTFCLSTNGLLLPQYAKELIELGVSHITVTMNAVDVKIGAKIYQYINYNGIRFEGESAAAILLANQLSGLKMLVAAGIICKVNIVSLKGINDKHIPEIVKTVKDLGCFVTNIMPQIQVEGSKFEHLEPLSNVEINEIRKTCGETMKQMYHCRQCRADAIGTLDHDQSLEFNQIQKSENQPASLEEKEYVFAVASKSGMLVDTHFGQVSEFYIYKYSGGKAVYQEKRDIEKYCTGALECDEEKDKIGKILVALEGCDGIIATRIGEAPKEKLKEKNISVFITYDRIEDAVKTAAFKLAEEIA